MENILKSLNKEQLSAVKTTNGSLLILAGAGSGKTKVLTSRIAYMVKNGVSPRDILAVTFTNKAAKEMKERLSGILGENVVKYMWVGTFHSICGRILRQDIDKYIFQSGKKLDKNFSIYDEQDSMAVIKQAIKKLNLDEKMYQPKLVKAIISNSKNKMQDAYTFATYARDFKSQRISQIYDDYESVLNNNNAIDFDDMLMLCVKLLEQNPEVREKYYNKFPHILVDEFQDTNQAQYNLVKSLYTNNKEPIPPERSLCVVGDVDQSIYSWRGADFKIILNFQHDFKNCKLIKLEQNYRSTEAILNAANSIIENNEQRVDKVLYSNKGEGEKITYYEADDDADEANYIASTIKQTSANYNQFAILYRTNAQSRSLEEACISMGIPYKIYGGLKFYDRKEIKDAIAYLKLIHNFNDSQSLKRIINVPRRAIGDTTIKHLQTYADENDLSLYGAIKELDSIDTIQQRTKTKLVEFTKLLEYFKSIQSNYALHEYISLILDKSGYLRELQTENTPEDEARIENLQELVNVASEFTPEDEENVLGEFLAQVSLVSDLDGMEEVSNNVTLMTLHSAKGLEFPIVFMAGLEDGIFPHSRTFNSMTELEEERRLMYVGVTRAEDKLYITSAKRRQMWGEYKYYNPSRFIDEIPPQLIEEAKTSGHSTGRTFQNAVKTIKSQTSGGYSSSNTISSGAKKLGNPQRQSHFGNSFSNERTISSGAKKLGSPQRQSLSNRTPAKSFVVKSEARKKREEERVKAFFENNPIKRKVEERRKQEEQQAILAEQKEAQKNARIDYFFNEGERVFHEKLGVGHIVEVVKIGDSTMYTIDFGKMGKKAMDANYAHLKKF
jgi:DNA helicase-2/ATP-dependent DNA helicase PcrA